jgi:hypothetical protein
VSLMVSKIYKMGDDDYLFHSEHFVEQCREKHEVDAGERLLRVRDLASVLQGILKKSNACIIARHNDESRSGF